MKILLSKSNHIMDFVVSEITKYPLATLIKKPKKESWSLLEIIEHLNLVYDIYLPKFNAVLANAKDLTKDHNMRPKSSIIGQMSIYAMTPKEKKRKFKMKTFDFFIPKEDSAKDLSVLNTFKKNKMEFNELLMQAELKEIGNVKMSTAINKVKFYVPECFAFVLAHEERHLVQIQETLMYIND